MTGQIILDGRSNFPQDLPKMFLVFLYENKYIISPQNGCINMANMAVIFDLSTYGS